MRYFALIALLIASLSTPALAQTDENDNPNIYDLWDFQAGNGMTGTVLITRSNCVFTVNSAFYHATITCAPIWNAEFIELTIAGNRVLSAFQVPVYLPEAARRPATESLASTPSAFSAFTFTLNKFGVQWMRGHLIGAGENVVVTLTRHQS